MRDILRRERLDPKCTQLSTEMAELNLATDLRESEEPTCACVTIEHFRTEPKLKVPANE
jgi:hypothetical protein